MQAAEQEFVAKVEAALQSNEVDEDRLIEERRRRRQEILAKHQQEQVGGAGGCIALPRLTEYIAMEASNGFLLASCVPAVILVTCCINRCLENLHAQPQADLYAGKAACTDGMSDRTS